MLKRLPHGARLAARAFLREQNAKTTRAEIPAISAEEVAEARLFFPLDKFFIFGHARSGTTLLTRLVQVHPQVHCNYQAHFFTRAPLLQSLVRDPEVGEWLARKSNRWNQGRDLSPAVLRAAADFILERDARRVNKAGAGCVVGDKSPNSLVDGKAVRLMHQVYPDGRLVYIVRDGHDAVLSHRIQAFIDFPHQLSKEDLRIRTAFESDPEPFTSGQRSLFTEKGLRLAAEGWVRNVVETDSEGQRLFSERYHSLRYEDLLADPHAEMRRLWAFLGVDAHAPGSDAALDAELLSNPDAEWQQHKAGEIAQPLKKGRSGAWESTFTARDRQLFREVAGETLKAWGYRV